MNARQIVMFALATTFGLVTATFAQNLPSNVPLPATLQIAKPADDLPAKVKAFTGKWVGSWGGVLDHVLVVEQIASLDQVVVVYAHGTAQNWNIWKPAWFRPMARFNSETLELRPRNGAFITYTLSSDDELRGTYELGSIISRITMKRVKE